MSVTPTSDTAAGIATITAVAALGNPKALPGTKMVVLDAQIYVGSPSCESLLGSLRFFNGSDIVFKHQSALYLIYATVSAFILCKLHVCSNTLTFSLHAWRMVLISAPLLTITLLVIYNG